MGAVKLLTVSVGVVWAAMVCRLVGPAAYLSLSNWLPRVYLAMASWLTPPYLYLVINGIILSIAASSRFTPLKSVPVPKNSVPVPVIPVPDPVSVEVTNPVAAHAKVPVPVPEPERKPVFEIPDLEEEEEEEEFVIRGPRWGVESRKEEEEVVPVLVYNVRSESTEMVSEDAARMMESAERPLVSARFGRKGVGARPSPSPEGKKALRVAKSRKGETLESTWRAITEGRAMPLARHLKKSDTWETRAPPPPPPAAAAMRKAETFHERGGGGVESPAMVLNNSGERERERERKMIKREPSLGQDDLNRRVEAFIRKFNEEMRMQRQESFKHYMDMINRGADQ